MSKRRRFVRKYQSGGVIPSFQGAQVLSRPFQVQNSPNPIIFNPNAVTQAVSARERSKQTAISQASTNRAERQLNWQRDIDNRNYTELKLKAIQDQFQAGIDSVTALDMNIPQQMKIATELKRELSRIQEESTSILLDSSLRPQERAARLNEKIMESKELMSNPDYIKHVQNNEIANGYYDQVSETLGNDDFLLDYDVLDRNMELVKQLQRGEITRDQFFRKVKNYAIDINAADEIEDNIYKVMTDALTKGPRNWEQYKGDPDAMIFIEKMQIGSAEDQAQALYDYLMSQEIWKKKQEASGRFTNDDGDIDPEKVMEFSRRTVDFYRTQYGIGDESEVRNTDIEVRNRTGGRGGGTTNSEQRDKIKILEDKGYQVNDPYAIEDMSPSEIEDLKETDMEDLNPTLDKDLIRKKKIIDRAVTRRPETEVIGDTSGGFKYDNLSSGNNDNILPDRLETNLGIYTNNPFNIKGDVNDPHITRYDYEDDDRYHRVFPTMEEGFKAGVSQIERYYLADGEQMPVHDKFRENLQKQGKTLPEATVADFYNTWATGATPELIKTIADEAGVTPDTKLVDVDPRDLARGLLKVENGEIYKQVFTEGGQSTPTGPTGDGGSGTPAQEQQPLTRRERIKQLEDYRSELIKNAKEYGDGDDVSDEVKQIDRALKEDRDYIKREQDALKSVEQLEPLQSVELDLGNTKTIRGSSAFGDPLPGTGVMDEKVTIKRSRSGDRYRISVGDRVIATNLTKEQLDYFIGAINGKDVDSFDEGVIDGNLVDIGDGTLKPLVNNRAGNKDNDVISEYYDN